MIDVSGLVGIRHELTYCVPVKRTVRHLLPEANEFQTMPEVLATGYLVALTEWACMRALRPYLEWPRLQTVGTHVDLSHCAPTPPGMRVRIAVELTEVDRQRLVFAVHAFDDVDEIAAGRHERRVIETDRFETGAARKADRVHDSRRAGQDSCAEPVEAAGAAGEPVEAPGEVERSPSPSG